ncbi:MAG TPA: SigE family RNA polymerase sigma factor, partial [Streptomyces sp.]|nr:SigE family RNA polymerase sigma factor [Streptomyces sp.]
MRPRPVRPRPARAAGGMPVIAPMPAARPARVPGQREGADDVTAAGTTVDHLTETYRTHYRSL